MELVYVILFLFGTVIGSFLNVVVYRLGTGEGVVRGRSRCFSCGTTLQWYDLLPIASFVLQQGRCRYCGSRISWQYPIVEFVTGMVFVLVVYHVLNYELGIMNYATKDIFNLLLTTYYLFLFSLLIAISVYDFRHKIIPNQLVYPFIILTLVFGNWKLEIGNFGVHIASGILAFLFFASLWFFSKGRWMGFGDAKLALGMGFLLGTSLTVLAGMLSFWIGALVSVPLVLARGGGMKTQIPFGPFLALATFAVWLWGEKMLLWYFSLFS